MPKLEELDCPVPLILMKKQIKEVKIHPEQYCYLTNKSQCDFVDFEENLSILST